MDLDKIGWTLKVMVLAMAIQTSVIFYFMSITNNSIAKIAQVAVKWSEEARVVFIRPGPAGVVKK
jgi:hypothetical protein